MISSLFRSYVIILAFCFSDTWLYVYVKMLSEMTEAVRNTDEVCWQIRNNEQPSHSDCPVFIPDAVSR